MPGSWFDLLAGIFKKKSPMSTNAPTNAPAPTPPSDTSSSPRTTKSPTSDILTNLSNLLPTGTFLAFQAIAPLFTNNGHCGLVERILTGILAFTFAFIVVILTFTDSLTTTSGKHYYGLVTCKGLWNPQFTTVNFTHGKPFYEGNVRRYVASGYDVINAILGVVVFLVLVLLTPPVSTCFYPNLPSTIVKAVPVLVGILAGLYFSFAPPPRRGVGYSVAGLVTEPANDSDPKVDDSRTGTGGTDAQSTVPASTTAATTATKGTGAQPTAPVGKNASVQLSEEGFPAKQPLLTPHQKTMQSTSPIRENFSSAV